MKLVHLVQWNKENRDTKITERKLSVQKAFYDDFYSLTIE